MDTNFFVYAHYTKDTNTLFYIGEGREKRAYSKLNRNKHWNNIVSKHGFTVKFLFCNITKEEAERIEKELIKKHRDSGDKICNVCEGTMFGKHWLIGLPKEMHPMFGKKSPKASARMKTWNSERSGIKSPTYGLKRPDLIERNKLKNFKRKFVKIKCVQTQVVYESIQDAEKSIGKNLKHICRDIKANHKTGGYNWVYV